MDNRVNSFIRVLTIACCFFVGGMVGHCARLHFESRIENAAREGVCSGSCRPTTGILINGVCYCSVGGDLQRLKLERK